jgi:hypothetical protein
MSYRQQSTRQKFEAGYWRRMKSAIQRHCLDNSIDKLSAKDAAALRHRWHELMQLPDSHTTWDRHHYTVIYRFCETYTERGELAALALDGRALYEESYRAGCIWVIRNRVGESYMESWIRNQLGLESWEGVPTLEDLSTDLLARASRTASQRARDRDAKPAPSTDRIPF